ncbi:MAG: hypothetical protein FJX51_11890 [Alphaproteobacteria bacterium]|nr:hypothetical protein [Alphaproteobacteria bacterium]
MRILCRVGRALGWALAALALAAFAWDLWTGAQQGAFMFTPAGELWFSLHAPSLNVAQAAVQRHVSAELWDRALFPLLTAPAWLLLGVPAFVLLRVRRR